MFRGILFYGASSSFGTWRAVWITSFIFGMLHITNGFITGNFNASIIQAFLAFLFGFYMIALRVRLGTIIPGIIIHWLWDFMTYLPTSQGRQLEYLELLLFFYGLWLLKNYLPLRYQTSINRVFHIITGSIYENYSCTGYDRERYSSEPQLFNNGFNEPELDDFEKSRLEEANFTGINFAGVSFKEICTKGAKMEFYDSRIVMKNEKTECQITADKVVDLELYIETLFDWATTAWDYSAIDKWNTDEYSILTLSHSLGFFKRKV